MNNTEIPNDTFPTQVQLRIDWSELDYFQHVNNVAFFKYIQASRVNYWDIIGLTKMHLDTNIGPILASCKCDFKLPLFYPGQITILARIDFIKNTSFGISHRILNHEGKIVAEAQDVLVMYDFNKNEKTAIPKIIIDNIQKLENTIF